MAPIKYKAVFATTLLTSWVSFGIFGDYNLYRGTETGTKILKDYATVPTILLLSLLLALVFAALNTCILWLFMKIPWLMELRRPNSSKSQTAK